MKSYSSLIVVFLLALNGAFHIYLAFAYSPTVNEVLQLPAGLSHIYLGNFDTFRVNPPLARVVAGVAANALSPSVNWQSVNKAPVERCENEVAADFLEANGSDCLRLFTAGRLACISFCLIGGLACFLFSRDAFGETSGVVALLLWSFCPFILGHGGLITSDVPAAATGIASVYLFWRWARHPSFAVAVWVGLCLGLAQLAKFTMLILYPIFAVLSIVLFISTKRHRSALYHIASITTIVIVSIATINSAYMFEGTGKQLGTFQFKSRLLTGAKAPVGQRVIGNRFGDSWIGNCAMPFPQNYIQGIDAQRWDFERKMWSYLGGEWKLGGWWHYYLYALFLKLPLGTLALIFVSGIYAVCNRRHLTLLVEMLILLPPCVLLVLVSSQTGFSIHSRYAIPALPYMYVYASRCFAVNNKNRVLYAAIVILLLYSITSSIFCYPHSMSYFNESIGGPNRGHNMLLDSNIAWGQDIYYLKKWYDDNTNACLLNLAVYSFVNPRLMGIKYTLPPTCPTSRESFSEFNLDECGPQPGWYAIDMNHLHGARLSATVYEGGARIPAATSSNLCYFQRLTPCAKAGYSIYIYHVSLDDANLLRVDLRLPQIHKVNITSGLPSGAAASPPKTSD